MFCLSSQVANTAHTGYSIQPHGGAVRTQAFPRWDPMSPGFPGCVCRSSYFDQWFSQGLPRTSGVCGTPHPQYPRVYLSQEFPGSFNLCLLRKKSESCCGIHLVSQKFTPPDVLGQGQMVCVTASGTLSPPTSVPVATMPGHQQQLKFGESVGAKGND